MYVMNCCFVSGEPGSSYQTGSDKIPLPGVSVWTRGRDVHWITFYRVCEGGQDVTNI